MPSALYTQEQVFTFLAFIREQNCFKSIDGRVQRNIEVFNKLSDLYNERYPASPKTGNQLRTKFKSLKSIYIKERIKIAKSGEFYSRTC